MTAPERRQFRRNLALGAVLTALLVGGTAVELFEPTERWLYDMRSRYCQRHTPPPTDQLVHLDIDDDSLALIGGWPWPRSTMAAVLEEVHRAGAKSLAMDVLYVERPLLESVSRKRRAGAPPPPPTTAPAGPVAPASEDQLLADALGRFRTVVPVSFQFTARAGMTVRQQELLRELTRDLELTREETERLVGHPIPQDEFLDALALAAEDRIRAESGAVDTSFEHLQAKLLPKGFATFGAGARTVPARVLQKAFADFKATQAMHHLARPMEPGLPKLLRPVSELAPLPELSASATAAGFVDFVPSPDGVVRGIPLWADSHQRLVPQLALALACLQFDIDLKSARLGPRSIELPRPGRPPIVIPVRTVQSDRLGEIGMFVDITFFGREQRWQSMYDYPARVEPKQHVPVAFVWDAIRVRERILTNNETVDEALLVMYQVQGAGKKMAALKTNPPPPVDVASRLVMIQDVLNDESLKPVVDHFRGLTSADMAAWTQREREDREKLLGAWDTLPVLADQIRLLAQQLRQKEGDLRDRFAGKAVLVGSAATAMGDFVPTSLHARCPGVVVHGTLFNAIATNHFRSRAPRWVTLAITACMGVLCTLLVSWLPGRWAMVWTAGLVVAYLAFNGWFLFDRQRLIVGAAGPLVAGAGVWTVLSLVRYVTETAERNRVTRRFRSYVDPALVAFVLEHPEKEFLEGEVREMTVVFTDLEGFTTLTERMREKAVEILSRFMSRMVPIIRRHRGFVNKFMGDGIMFFFGAPDENEQHAADAVTTVLEMQKEMERFNEELEAQGSPTVRLRAGVTTGLMVVGDAGDKTRCDYTVLGDPVNLSARLESANKAFGTRVLVSERTVEHAGGRFLFRPVGRIRVAGKTEGVMAYEPVCAADAATAEEKQLVRACQEVIDCFGGGRFGDCLEALRRLEEVDGRALGKWCGVLRDLCQGYVASPPEAFDRTIVLKEK